MDDYLLLPHGIHANIYIRELARAYQSLGLRVVLGADNLAELDHAPRFLHLHWPEEHYRWTGSGSVDARAAAFVAKLRWLQGQGTRIAWTVHNLAPHDQADHPADRLAYEAVIELADLVVHHCDCSVDLLQQRYPQARERRHAVSPHGHFMGYPQGATRADARRRLGLPEDATVFLQFGQVRAYKGLQAMLDAFAALPLPRKHLLVAGRYAPPPGRRTLRDRLQMAWLERWSKTTTMHLREIGNDEIQHYMAAADALVLTHRAGLNSGVAILGMSFGKAVVAPDIGCVPEVLAQGRNFVYPTGNQAALVQAMQDAVAADADAVRRENLAAASSWRWEDTARTVVEHLRGNTA